MFQCDRDEVLSKLGDILQGYKLENGFLED